jgi:hypothetical protein
MSAEKDFVDTVEDASLRSPNEGQALCLEGMSEDEMKKFVRKRKYIYSLKLQCTYDIPSCLEN